MPMIARLYRSMKRIQGWSMLAVLILGLANPAVTQAQAAQPAAAVNAGSSPGISWTGGMGIRETTAQIMARQNSANGQSSIAGRSFFNGKVDFGSKQLNPASAGLVQGPAVLAPAVPGPSVAQSIGINFDGPDHDANPCGTPPDTMGAVGPTQFIVAVNCKIVSYNKTTGAADGVINTDPDAFFASLRGASFVSDPHIRYDRISGRWFIVIINVAFPDNRILLAVSDTATITALTHWTFFFFQDSLAGHANCLGDYPTPGIDANAIYLGINEFCGSNLNTAVYLQSDGFVIQKSSVLGAGPIHVTAFPLLGNMSGGLFTPQGVDNPDPAATEGYFIGADGGTFGKLDLRRVTNPGGVSPTISSTVAITTALQGPPINQPHKNNNNPTFGKLDGSDGRLFAAYFRNGSLWTSLDSSVHVSSGVCVANGTAGDRDAVFWYELTGIPSGSAPSVHQAGVICDTAAVDPAFYSYGAIMVNGQGHAAIGYTIAGNANFTEPGFSGRLSGDPLSTQQAVSVIVPGTHPYNPSYDSGLTNGFRRWGDFSYTSLDPCDDMTLWTIQEYASSDNIYGERVAQLLAPPPPILDTTLSVTTGQASVSVILPATSINSSGFYDTPSSLMDPCRKRLQVSISGGVVVNSVTFTDPTHLSLNISTVGVTSGSKNVTVTNPDGQSVTGIAILPVGNASSTSVSSSADPSVYGEPVTFTASVSSGGGKPTGSVTFYDGTTPIGNGALGMAGTAALTTSILPVGTHAISATYNGDANFAASTGVLPGGQVVNQAPTTLGVVSNNNPSGRGQAVTFTATVSSNPGLTPIGSVTFTIDGVPTPLPLDSNGMASLTTSFASLGDHTVHVEFPGSANFAASAPTDLIQRVWNKIYLPIVMN